MATPQVTGTIALMYAAMPQEMMQVCKDDPAIFSLSVRQSLFDGADHLASLDGLVAEGRRLNAFGAIEELIDNWRPNELGENKTEDFKVYPNPTTGSVTVEGKGQLVVINTLGQVVIREEIDGNTTMTLPLGLYFVKLDNTVRKVVVE